MPSTHGCYYPITSCRIKCIVVVMTLACPISEMARISHTSPDYPNFATKMPIGLWPAEAFDFQRRVTHISYAMFPFSLFPTSPVQFDIWHGLRGSP